MGGGGQNTTPTPPQCIYTSSFIKTRKAGKFNLYSYIHKIFQAFQLKKVKDEVEDKDFPYLNNETPIFMLQLVWDLNLYVP